MIGYFGSVIFQTSQRKLLTFSSMKRTASASYSDHKRIGKKSQREFNGPQNQTVSFTMLLKAGHGIKPRKTMDKVFNICESGEVCTFVLGRKKVGSGKWTIDSVDAVYNQVFDEGELVSVTLNVTATEYY